MMIVVVRLVGVIMSVVMEGGFGKRLQQIVEMRCCREMDRNVIEIEDKHCGDEQTSPPTRFP